MSQRCMLRSKLLLPVIILLSACGDSIDTRPFVTALDAPQKLIDSPNSLPAEAEPEIRFDGESVALVENASPYLQKVSIVDAGAESGLKPGRVQSNTPGNGFEVMGDCLYGNDDVAASNGYWRFELAVDCQLLQFSDTVLQPGMAASLVFDIKLDSSATGEQMVAEIVAETDSGERASLASRAFARGYEDVSWKPVQVSIAFAAADVHAGKRLGIVFRNVHTNAVIAIDNIEFSVHAPAGSTANNEPVFTHSWQQQCNQQWVGKEFWSNRLQDWKVSHGRLVTTNVSEQHPDRTTHRITTAMGSTPANFSFKVDTGVQGVSHAGSYSGLLIGAGGRMDYRSSSLVHNRHGRNGGLIVGIDANGRAFVLDNGVSKQRLADGDSSSASDAGGATLQVEGTARSDGAYSIAVFALRAGTVLSSTVAVVEAEKLLGNVAVVSNPGSGTTSHWFDNWKGFGAKLHEIPARRLGPVLFSSYTISRKVLTLNAQFPPLCVDSMVDPVLQVWVNGDWQAVSTAAIDPQSYTARFEVGQWEWSQAVRYRIATSLMSSAEQQPQYFQGAIRPEPVADPEFVLGVYNCRPGVMASNTEGWIQQKNQSPFSWTRERVVFPHEELLENSMQHHPDMVVFVGDQIYEFDPNGLVDKHSDRIVLDYLWKWYQFGWAAREVMRNTPSFILPDDHDVYQANVWGESGIAADVPEDGGYVHAPSFIDVVQKTQTGSLPAPADLRLLEQGISSYYTSMVYGGIGFAVLEDRKFKTGPHSPQGPAQLLGEAQHEFLDQWAADWRGQTLKIAVSQSPFSQSTTHSGQNFKRIEKDLDSNGWPKTGRDEAVHLLRKAYAPHIAGDQHLGMSLKHGIEMQGDAIHSFAGPSMLNIFPRIWDPANTSDGPGDRSSVYEGQYTDAHGNFIEILAAANPDVYYLPPDENRLPSKNQLGIGYGIVKLDKPGKRYMFEAWPANVSPATSGARPFSGWPVMTSQHDNDGRVPSGYLTARRALVTEPVVQVFVEGSDKLVYARRYSSPNVELPVFDNALTYRVVISDLESGYREQFDGQQANQ